MDEINETDEMDETDQIDETASRLVRLGGAPRKISNVRPRNTLLTSKYGAKRISVFLHIPS
jgi:hypothetical protein